MPYRESSLPFVSILLAFPLVFIAFGQGERATVTGLVTDPTGAVVVGAEIAIRNTATNVVARTRTNAAGIYYLPALPPGRYELRAEQAGFRPAVVADIPLSVALTATVNVKLELGVVTEAVEVQATAVQLESQTTGLGKLLETRSIAELPVLGRNPLQLAALAPGVTPVGGETLGIGSRAKISGGLGNQNTVLTDGGESRGTISASGAYSVPLEAVAEVKVETATYPAEFGRSGGGLINIVTKSGTNELHGVVYEFLRNDHLNANSWQNNRNKVPKGQFQRNEFGAAVGGRIVRDRSFFFATYEGIQQGTPVQFLSTVPSAEQKSGDFTQTLDRSGRAFTVYDPLATRSDPARPGNYIRDAFPGNRIAPSRIHPISQNVTKYWPDSNRAGEGPARFNNYFKSGKGVTGSNSWLGRIDHIINDRHRLFGRVSGGQRRSFDLGLPEIAFPARSISSNPTRSGLVSLTSTFSPSLLGELRLSYTRLQFNSYPKSEDFDLGTLGFPENFTRNITYRSFPGVYVQQYVSGTGLSITFGTGSEEVGTLGGDQKSLSPQDTWHLQYHLTVLRNRHKIKAGTDLELLRLNTYNSQYASGRFLFDREYTQGPDPGVPTSSGGHGFASFLLGVPISGSLTSPPRLMLHQKYYGFYVQDDIQLTARLTLNLGLRYEYTTPWADKHAQIGNLDLTGIEPITGERGTFKFLEPGQFQNDPNRRNFGPRVGLAYRVTPKTVIRAAGAIFYSATNTINAGSSDFGNGTYVLNELSLGPPNPVPHTPPVGGSWSNPFAAGLSQPDRSSTFAGENLRADVRRHPLAYLSNWTFNIQQMLRPTLLAEISYVGSKATNVNSNRHWNQNDPLLLSLGSRLLDRVPNPYFGKIKSGPLSFATVERRQLLRPFPQYLDVIVPRDAYGDMNYHGLMMRLEKQYSHGLSVSAGYTISKTLTNAYEAGGVGPPISHNAFFAPGYNRAHEANDLPHRLVLSYHWDFPVGNGRSYLSRGYVSKIIGSWQLSGITVFQSGRPLYMTGPDNTRLFSFSVTTARASRLKDPVLPSDQRTTARYFDTTAFAAAAPFTLPTDSLIQPRLREPGRRNFDVSLIRNQRFKERYNVQFRLETFNLFNTPALRLGARSTSVTSPEFGQILEGTAERNIQLALRIVF